MKNVKMGKFQVKSRDAIAFLTVQFQIEDKSGDAAAFKLTENSRLSGEVRLGDCKK